MPEDLPKAIMILLWLLSGTIIFGVLLMKTDVLYTVIFAIGFFGIPVFIYKTLNKSE